MNRVMSASAARAMPNIRLSHGVVAGFAWGTLALLIFSGWFVVTRLSVTHTLGIWDIAALRFGIGAVLLSPALLRPGRWPGRAAWREGPVLAALWGLPFVLLVALGLKLTSAAEAAAIAPTLMPVFAGLLAAALLGERQGLARWAGYAVILGGLVLLVGSQHGVPNAAGIAALTMAAAMWATYTLLFRRSRLASMQAAALICLWSAAFVLPVYLLCGLSHFGRASAGEIALQALYQGVLMSGVALFSFNRAVSQLGAVAATAIIALLPAVAALLAIPVLHEIPTPPEAIAIAAIVVGVLLAARPRPAGKPPQATAERRRK